MTGQCPICGKPTRVWYGNARKDGLCGEHADMLKAGKLVRCEDCGNYHDPAEPCICHRPRYTELPTDGFSQCVACGAKTNGYAFCRDCYHRLDEEQMLGILNGDLIVSQPQKEEPAAANHAPAPQKPQEGDEEDEEDEEEKKHPFARGKCLICGYDSGENYLCSRCYYKYKEKTLLLKITKCQDVELTEESYEGIYKCKDGHIVRSNNEVYIDDYLTQEGIWHAYEKSLAIKDENGESVELKPDFCLFDYLGKGKNVWWEHWGINEEENQKYKKTKKFKMKLYKKLLAEDPNFTLITTSKEDTHDFSNVIERKLNKNNIIPNTIDGKKA